MPKVPKRQICKILQCLKKEVRNEVDLCADIHQSFLQVDHIKYNGHSQASVSHPHTSISMDAQIFSPNLLG